MHNIEEDATLRLVGRECRITRVYYTEKFREHAADDRRREHRRHGNHGDARSSLNGNIDIYSPLPTNNTIRRIDLEVTNEDGVTRTVTIAQYLLAYITNILGWYPYGRGDFGNDLKLLAVEHWMERHSIRAPEVSNWI